MGFPLSLCQWKCLQPQCLKGTVEYLKQLKKVDCQRQVLIQVFRTSNYYICFFEAFNQC